MGIGGQYAAINSAIDEMMPSKYRGRVDIWINGTYWAGAILGSFLPSVFLNHFAPNVGWRLAFLMGPVLALVVIIVGRVLPESPRWLMTHGHTEEAEKEMAKIEAAVRKFGRNLAPVDESNAIEPLPEKQYGYLVFLCLVFRQYPRRAILGATLMITQSFFVQRDLLLLRLRASSAYLTVSETWPIEIRAEAIAVFFAIGSISGALGPAFYGALIGDGSNKTGLFIGYLAGRRRHHADRRAGRGLPGRQRRRQVTGGDHQTTDLGQRRRGTRRTRRCVGV